MTPSFSHHIVLDYCDINNPSLNLSSAKRMLDAIFDFHSLYYGDISSAQKMQLNIYSGKDYQKSKKIISELYHSRHDDNIRRYGKKNDQKIGAFIDDIEETMDKYKDHRTFTHNDFSTRNCFIDDKQVKFFDYELSCYQNPEHDLIEFLMYDLDSFTNTEVKKLLDYYGKKIKSHSKMKVSDSEYQELLKINAYEFIINRLSLTRTINDYVPLDFAKTSIPNSTRLLNILEDYCG